jgi:predicted ArsR family transcriptional regulator
MPRLTTADVARNLGVSYVVAAGIVKHLVDSGKANLVDKIRHESGKGKPTRVYEVSDSVALNFGNVSEAA